MASATPPEGPTGAILRPGSWLPVAAFLVVAAVSAAGWWAIERQEARLADAVLEQRANTVQAALRAGIVARADSIQRMAQRLARARDEAELARQFDVETGIYLRQYPSLRSMAWVGPGRLVRRSVARQGAPVLPAGATLDFDPVPLADRGAEPAAARSLLLKDSNGEILVVRIDGSGGEAATYLVVALDYGKLFPDLLRDVESGQPLRVSQGGRVIHARGVPQGVAAALDRRIANQGQEARIELWPTPGAALTSRLDEILFGAGLLVGVLLALALQLWIRSRERAEHAERVGEALTAQIAENEADRMARLAVERELGSVFESISDAFYTLDEDWRFVLVNPRAEQLMHVPRDQLVGQRVWDVFPAVLDTEVETSFRRAAAERVTVEFDVYFPPLASWFTARVFPHPNGVAVYFQDISERKRAELGMLKAQATSGRAQRLAQLGSWEYDLTTGELVWSEEAQRIFGIPEARLARGLPALLERVHFDDRAALQDAQRRLHAGDGDIDIEYRVLRPDGEIRIVRELGTLVRDDQGSPVAAAGALQDITDRRRHEDALRELTGRLEQSLVMNRLVMDNSLDVICVIDVNGRFAQVSAASQRVWGYAAKDMVGRAFIDFVHPDDRGHTLRANVEVLGGRPTLDFRNRLLHRDGHAVEMQWSSVWSPRDRLVFAVARDVSDLERQSQALLRANDSLQRAQAIARMGSWELELASGRLTWSEHAYRIYRVAPEEFAGSFEDFAARVHPDDLPALQAAMERARRGEGELDLQHRILWPGGEVGHVHERARLLRNDQGVPWLLSGSVQDVTEEKRQEALLRESEQRMRTTIYSALDCIVSMNSEGDILEFNPAAERTFGYRRDQVLGHKLADKLLPPESRDAHTEGLRRHAETGRERVLGRRLEMTAMRADGSRFPVELAITRLGDSVPPVFTGFMRDVTEAKRIERMEAGQRGILAGIAARRPMRESLEAVTRLYEQQYPGALCSVLLIDDAGERVLHGAAPSLPETYNLALHGLLIGEGVGSCGTAATRGERVVVTDIATDPLWKDFAALALEHGLHACWSTPVKSAQGRVLATFATYYRDVRAPTESELQAIDSMAAMAAMAIEQDKAYRQVELSEQRFRSLFDEHPDAVCAMDLEGHFTAFNEHFLAQMRGGPDQLLGRMFDERIAPEQRDLVRAHFHAAAGGQARSYEITAVTLDGQRVELRITNLPIVVDGRVTGVFGIGQDISLLRKHQRELAQALDAAEANSLQLRRLSQASITLNRDLAEQGLYQQLVDQLRGTLGVHQAVVSVDNGDGTGQLINAISLSDKYAEWRGYDAPIDGTGIYMMVGETGKPMRLTQAELEAHPRWRGFGKHAAEHPPMRGWLAVPLFGSDGARLGVLQLSDKHKGEFTEDDEQVAVQFAQMASIAIERARLIGKLQVRDRFFDMSAEVFVIFDPARRRWVQVNPVFSQITGYSAEELCSRDFTEFVYPEDRDLATGRAGSLARGDAVSPGFKVRYVCRDGSVRWLDWVSVPAPDGLVYAVGRDITERQQAELALRQTLVDLNNRNRELQDFAFIASHDLQEPLRKIRAFSDRLQQRHAAALEPEARDYLDRTGQAAARMQVLIDDLLAYSRVAARGRPFQPVDLNALLATVLDDLEARLESSGGRVEAGPLPTLDGDATQLRQVFQNLLANALKFRSPGRAPVVSINASAEASEGEDGWRLVFADNGIGFDDKYAERIFGPFQRLHGRQDYEGTGIGLAIVRRIVERHRGTIRAQGRTGEGAAFTLWLPQRQRPTPAATTVPLAGPEAAPPGA